MLPGLKHRESGTIGGLQIDRADGVAFRFDPHHPQRPPLIAQGLGLQTSPGLLPGTGQQAGGGNAIETPAQSQCCRAPDHVFHLECPEALRTLKSFDLRAFKDDFGAPAELQQITGVEIDKQQTGARVEQQVAQGVEKQIAGEIRNGQAIAFHLDEPGLTAAVRNVHRALTIDVHITGDEKGIGPRDHGSGCIIQPVEVLGGASRRVRQRHRAKLPQLNVLRAIAEGLFHAHSETAGCH
ncbi:hypothetical protein D3C87_1271410 [compost metagenome]